MGVEEVLGHIPAAVVVVEAGSRRIVYANPRARQMTAQLDRSIPQDLTEDWEIFHHDGRPYDVDEWPLVRSLTTGEQVADEEYFNLRANGIRLYVRASSAPIVDDAGAIVGGVLVMTDVTERKAEAERLTYLAGLLDNTEDAIVAFDAEWFLTAWNAGAERMYGWTADEVLGRHTLDVARLEMSYEERVEVRHAVAEHGRWRGEVNGVTFSSGAQRTWPSTATSSAGSRVWTARCSSTSDGVGTTSSSRNSTSGVVAARQPALRAAPAPGRAA